MADVVVVAGKRTPFGRFGGSLREIPAVELGALVMRQVLDENPAIAPEEVDEVIMGLCLPGSGLSPARQAVLAAGLPLATNGLTIDRACCSALTASGIGFSYLRAGRARVVLAGGMENMSRTPYLLPQARWGNRLGDFTVQDDLVIRNPYVGEPMARYVGETSLAWGVGREEQDAWALRSQRAWAAAQEGRKFDDEILPVKIADKRGGEQVLKWDEHPRPDTSLEKLASLPTVYGSATVTAGNASGICDGAAAVLLTTRELAAERGLQPLATIVGYRAICGEPRESPSLPGVAIGQLLEECGLPLSEMKLIEINEAFAAMPLVSSLVLGERDHRMAERIRERINVNGGAVAIGHPLGATGARLLMTLIYELRRRGGGYGVVGICGAIGQADAMVVRVD